MTPNEYCQQKILIPGSGRYYSLLLLPKEKKAAATALYAFHREISEIVNECSDEHVARVKFNWWHEEIQRLFKNQARHPVSQALQSSIKQYTLKQAHFEEIINGLQLDLQYNSYKTFDDLFHYCYRSTAVLELLLAEVFSYQDTAIQEYAKHLGLAIRLSHILLNIRNDAANGRIYLPLDELAHFKLKPSDLEKSVSNEQTEALFAFQYDRIIECFDNAFQVLAKPDRLSQISNIIFSKINEAILLEIKKDGFRLLQQQLRLTPLRMLWIAWNTARKERKLYQYK